MFNVIVCLIFHRRLRDTKEFTLKRKCLDPTVSRNLNCILNINLGYLTCLCCFGFFLGGGVTGICYIFDGFQLKISMNDIS